MTYNDNTSSFSINISTDAKGLGDILYVTTDGKLGSENGTDMKLSVSRITLHKKMYEPCYVDVEMVFDNIEYFADTEYVDGLKKFFIGKSNKLTVEGGPTGTINIAQGYYVQTMKMKKVWREKVDSTNKTKTGRNVFLVIIRAYSPDYFLTLTKYSKAYGNKCFSEILKEEIVTNRGLFSSINNSNLCHTVFNDEELRQPYLVQYNESFHDFAVRVANRCGELFYYENGTLNYGLESSNINKDNTLVVAADKIEIEPEEFTFECDYPSKAVPQEQLFRRNLNNNNYEISASNDSYYYDDNVVKEDFFRRINSEKDSLSKSQINDSYWLGIVNEFFKASDFIEAFSNPIKQACIIPMTSALLRDGVGEDKVAIKSDEETAFNDLQNKVPERVLDVEDQNILEQFKKDFQTSHPEYFQSPGEQKEFSDAEIKAYWEDTSSKGYNELTKFKSKLKRYSAVEREYKEEYEKLNPTEFEEVFNLENKAWEGLTNTEASDYEKYKETAPTTDSEIKNFKEYDLRYNNCTKLAEFQTKQKDENVGRWKKNYIEQHPDEFKEATKDPFEDINSQAYKALKEAEPNLECSANATADFKERYEANHPEYFKYTMPKNNVWDDEQHKQILKDIENNDFFKFIKNKMDEYEKKHSSEFKSLTTDEKEEKWESSSEDCYKWIIEEFKTKFKKNYPNEFKKTGAPVKHTEDQIKKDWTEGTPYRVLEAKKALMKMDERDLTNAFYSWIEIAEKKNSKGIQVQKVDTVPTSMLGQFVRLSNTMSETIHMVYAVDIDIYNALEENIKSTSGNTSHKHTFTEKTCIDASVTYSPTMPDKIRGDKKEYQYSVFPPLADIPHIRRAQPQQAIISNIADPLRMGRVQITYPWNKNGEGKSPWLTMLSPFASGEENGIALPPNVGDYVMVDYEGGNVERPYVNGAMFHGEAAPSWGSTPQTEKFWNWRNAHRSIKVDGNGLTFFPGKSQTFFANLLPSCAGVFLNNIEDNLLEHNGYLGGGFNISDYYGLYNISGSSGSRSISIDSPWGKVGINAFTGISISAPNGDIKISGKNVTIEAGNNIKLVSGKNIRPKDKTTTSIVGGVMGTVGAVAGSALNTLAMSKLKLDLTKLVDFSFLRSVLEVILRPVDGSITLESGRNISLQSGGGKVATPSSTLSAVAKPQAKSITSGMDVVKSIFPSSDTSAQKEAEAKEPATETKIKVSNLIKYKNELITQLDTFVNTHNQNISNYTYNEITQNILDKLGNDWNSLENIKRKVEAEGWNDLNENSAGLFKEGVDFNENEKKDIASKINLIHTNFVAINTYLTNTRNFKAITEIPNPSGEGNMEVGSAGIDADLSNVSIKSLFYADEGWNDHKKETISAELQLTAKRKLINKLLVKGVTGNIITKDQQKGYNQPVGDNLFTNANWSKYIALHHVGPRPDSDRWKVAKSAASSFMAGAGLGDLYSYDADKSEATFFGSLAKTFNAKGTAGPRSVWDVSQGKGAILLSASDGRTHCLDSDTWRQIYAPLYNIDQMFDGTQPAVMPQADN